MMTSCWDLEQITLIQEMGMIRLHLEEEMMSSKPKMEMIKSMVETEQTLLMQAKVITTLKEIKKMIL